MDGQVVAVTADFVWGNLCGVPGDVSSGDMNYRQTLQPLRLRLVKSTARQAALRVSRPGAPFIALLFHAMSGSTSIFARTLNTGERSSLGDYIEATKTHRAKRLHQPCGRWFFRIRTMPFVGSEQPPDLPARARQNGFGRKCSGRSATDQSTRRKDSRQHRRVVE